MGKLARRGRSRFDSVVSHSCLTAMKTTIRSFQRDFPRMRRLAAAGTVIVVECDGQSFEFRRRRAGTGVLGCLAGRAKLGKLREGPAIPLAEWGDLTR